MLQDVINIQPSSEARVHGKHWMHQSKKRKREIPEGFYHVELNKTDWVVPDRYQNLKPLASGAYGCVCSADDMITGERVALKKVGGAFQSKVFAKRTFREIALLSKMQHENVIQLVDVFTSATSLQDFNTVYLVTTLMNGDLSGVISHNRKLGIALTEHHIQFLIYQIVRGLKYVHSGGIIHRDLKPQNIGINSDCTVRIIDFGLARISEPEMTGYITTRWWRAPEVMLNWMKYDNIIDVWSVACIMAEMYLGEPLFAGRDHIDQLKKIIQVCGSPSESFMHRIDCPSAQSFVRQMPQVPRRKFAELFPTASPAALDFLEQSLQIDPRERMSIEEMLTHPFLALFHDPEDEPVAEFPLEFVPEEPCMGTDEWKELAWDEIVHFQLRQTGGDLLSSDDDDDLYEL